MLVWRRKHKVVLRGLRKIFVMAMILKPIRSIHSEPYNMSILFDFIGSYCLLLRENRSATNSD
jgi:hypothetical protein